jgi:hypothetical protein
MVFRPAHAIRIAREGASHPGLSVKECLCVRGTNGAFKAKFGQEFVLGGDEAVVGCA